MFQSASDDAVSIPGPVWLFCPGHRPNLFEKAERQAECIVLDLEDAVAPDQRAVARREVAAALRDLDPTRTVVRMNSPTSSAGKEDIAMLASSPVEMVMVPKVEGRLRIPGLEGRRLVPLVETPDGAIHIRSIASSDDLAALAWGSEDYASSLGGRSSRGDDGALLPSAQSLRVSVLASAALVGTSAVDSVQVHLNRSGELLAESREAALMGFVGKFAVHPQQAEIIRQGFRPTPQESEWARGVLAAVAEAGPSVFQHEGRMIDKPVLRQAEAIARLWRD